MTAKRRYGNAQAVSDIAARLLDPVMRRRAGLSVALVQCWEEVAGPRLGAVSRPERIVWPRRAGEDDPFEPATLVVACEGLAALHIQHETGEIVARVNAFLGFAAVGRIKIVQKPLRQEARRARPAPPEPDAGAQLRVRELTAGVEDEGLREALARLGRNVLSQRR